jgi:non-canonical poly(A) RNA polymerase PAPD5/7
MKRKRSRERGGSDTEGMREEPPPGCPWMIHCQYSRLDSVQRMLTQELLDFVDFLSPSPEEHQIRKYAFKQVEKCILQSYPNAKVIIFGSFETQLYLPSR